MTQAAKGAAQAENEDWNAGERYEETKKSAGAGSFTGPESHAEQRRFTGPESLAGADGEEKAEKRSGTEKERTAGEGASDGPCGHHCAGSCGYRRICFPDP